MPNIFKDSDFLCSAVSDRPDPTAHLTVTETGVISPAVEGNANLTDVGPSTNSANVRPADVVPSTSSANVRPADVMPYPKAGPRAVSNRGKFLEFIQQMTISYMFCFLFSGRKRGKTTILTITPEKAAETAAKVVSLIKKKPTKRRLIAESESDESESESGSIECDSDTETETFSDLAENLVGEDDDSVADDNGSELVPCKSFLLNCSIFYKL